MAAGHITGIPGTSAAKPAVLHMPPPLPTRPPELDKPHKRNWYERMWDYQAAEDTIRKVFRIASQTVNTFSAGIKVVVQGGPGADIRRIWYLALSTALGRYRNRVLGALNTVEYSAIWDISGKACQVVIAYQTNAITQSASALADRLVGWNVAGRFVPLAEPKIADLLPGGTFDIGLGAIPGLLDAAVAKKVARFPLLRPGGEYAALIQRGPEQLSVGGDLPAWMRLQTISEGTPSFAYGPGTQPGLPCGTIRTMKAGFSRPAGGILREWPTGAAGGFARYPYSILLVLDATGMPVASGNPLGQAIDGNGNIPMPDSGRVVTTAEKYNPAVQPPQPEVDGIKTSLLALVAQALQTPCFLPQTPRCTTVTNPGGTGVWVPLMGPGAINNTVDPLAASAAIQAAALGREAAYTDPAGNLTDGALFVPQTPPDFRGATPACIEGGYPPPVPPVSSTPPPRPRTPPPNAPPTFISPADTAKTTP